MTAILEKKKKSALTQKKQQGELSIVVSFTGDQTELARVSSDL